ncbi:hypothetical protein [Rhodococcus chondri]|uniref:Uncharacterized protein n=1 Tax=Rhodococcus chondri TaxID=3065941 RepID=A0ABU7JTY7_9NOCA|nr:hypothetical protein [Rhodococcus sp. CC-R104]MEE2033491.1 hypothetical protein [Rhodococcus sp. CC-R104]
MTALDSPTRPGPRVPGVDIAGTSWPLYKLEAMVLGFVVLAAVFVATGDTQSAVLVAATVTTVTWWIRLLHYRRSLP